MPEESSKGYIFDFNGTLFWDTNYHNDAWLQYSKTKGFNITIDYLREHLHGKTNHEIFRILLNGDISREEASALSEEKESIYRDIVNNLEEGPELAPGAENVLENLSNKGIPMTIATSSSRENVEFYKQTFDLERWFPSDKIVYDDGSFRGKPAPDIFLIAAQRLGLPPGECTVVEDSVTGIQSAQAAGIGKIYLITSGNHLAWDNSDPDIQIIQDFTEFRIEAVE